MILIFLIVLLLFGAKKVPELFRSLGKGVNEFRKAKNEWEQDINEVMSQEPLEDHDFSESEHKSDKKDKRGHSDKSRAASRLAPPTAPSIPPLRIVTLPNRGSSLHWLSAGWEERRAPSPLRPDRGGVGGHRRASAWDEEGEGAVVEVEE